MKHFGILLAFFLLAATCSLAIEAVKEKPKRALACSLSVEKNEYKVGETARFTVTLTNTGQLPLRVVKEGGASNCLSHINWESDGPKKASPFTCECIPMPFTGTLDQTVLLKSGETHKFKMSYTIHRKHREFCYAYVRYSIPGHQDGHRVKAPKWVEEVKNNSPLWIGSVRSNRITLKITEKE